MITPAQIRAARGLLAMSQGDLAKAVNLAGTSLGRIENGLVDPRSSTLARIQAALEARGVIFLPENGGGAGVRLKKG